MRRMIAWPLAAALLLQPTISIAASLGYGPLAVQNGLSELAPVAPAVRRTLNVLADGVNVTDPAYGAVADGKKGFFYATWTNVGNSLSAYTLSATVSIASGTNILTWSGTDTGNTFQPDDVGKSIAVAGTTFGGGKQVTHISQWLSGQKVLTVDNADSTLSAVANTQMIWPAFEAADVGKTIMVDRGTTDGTIGFPFLQNAAPLLTTIATQSTPFAITTAANFGNSNGGLAATAAPTRVWWGTDNTSAIVTASIAAVGSGTNGNRIYFPNTATGGTYCAFNLAPHVSQVGSGVPYAGMWETFAGTRWIGDENTDDCFTDLAGTPVAQHIIPRFAGEPPGPSILINGAQHLQRFADTSTPLPVMWGDSMCPDQIQAPQPPSRHPVAALMEALQQQNPAKSIYAPVDRCINGGHWDFLASTSPITNQWYTSSATQWFSTISPVAPLIQGASTQVPDLVFTFNNGGNDSWQVSDKSFNTALNLVAGLGVDAYNRPPDQLLTTAAPGGMIRSYGVNPTPGAEAPYYQHGREYSSGLVRNTGVVRGYGVFDPETIGELALWGWSPRHTPLRHIPDHTSSAINATASQVIRDYTRNFKADWTLTGANGAAVWGSNRVLLVQVSPKPDNVVRISTNSGGYLTVEQDVWGGLCTDNVTITSGAAALSVAGGSTAAYTYYVNSIKAVHNGWPGLNFSASFPTLSQGTQVLLSTSQGYSGVNGGAVRTWVSDKFNTTNLMVADQPYVTGQSPVSQNITSGGCNFVADDASAKIDIIVPGAGTAPSTGGTTNNLVTKVASYSSATAVGLANNAGATLAAAFEPVWMGHIAIPYTVSPVAAGADAGANPVLTVNVTDGQLYVGYQRASDTQIQTVYRGPLIRYGGPFYPRIWSNGGSGSLTVQATNVWTDGKLLFRPQYTGRELYGSLQDSLYDDNLGGNGASHLTTTLFEAVFKPLARAQALGTPPPSFGGVATLVPLTGFSNTIPNGVDNYVLKPAGTLASGALTMPATFPAGKALRIVTTQTITSLTVSANSGQTITGAPSAATLSAGKAVTCAFDSTAAWSCAQ